MKNKFFTPNFSIDKVKSFINDEYGYGDWMLLRSRYYDNYTMNPNQGYHFYSFVRPENYVQNELSNHDWFSDKKEMSSGFCCWYSTKNNLEVYEWVRTWDYESYDSIVYIRGDDIEISEEFRHFHDLRKNKDGNYEAKTETGDMEEVIRIKDGVVQGKTKYIKQYISAKDAVLILCFFIEQINKKCSLADMGLEKIEDKDKTENLIYCFSQLNSPRSEDMSIQGIKGKKIISASEEYKPELFPNEKYEKFIIGVNADGSDKLFTCDKDQLANCFGKNPENPHYLTPVWFKSEVMDKYNNDPKKYQVEDNIIRYGYAWDIIISNSRRDDKIMVYLGDLAGMPHSEQLYWKSFNLYDSKLKISQSAIKRDFFAQFADSENPVIHIKNESSDFGRKWKEKYGWDLFAPSNQSIWNELHPPTNGTKQEFIKLVLVLDKFFVESINKKEIKPLLGASSKKDNGITLLGKLINENTQEANDITATLNHLHTIRNKVAAHDIDYENDLKCKAAFEYFGIDENNYKESFFRIVEKLTGFLVAVSNMRMNKE